MVWLPMRVISVVAVPCSVVVVMVLVFVLTTVMTLAACAAEGGSNAPDQESRMFKFWYGATMLSIESQNVIALRMMKLAMGGKHAQAEASRMVTEKIAESMAVAVTLMSGGSGHAVVAQVRRRVRSNSRRLSR